MTKEALVVERGILFKDKYFKDFLTADEHDYITTILKNYFYHERGDALENNHALQQIVPYVWIVNPKAKKIFVYRRAGNKNYKEKRLRNKWSCGIGGHIEKEDAANPIINAMMRELQEEVKMPVYPQPKIIGYLNDDSSDVGKVHFGIVAIAETTYDVEKGDDEMVEGKFMSVSELEGLFSNPNNDIESWTKLSLPFVKSYIENLPN